MNNFAKLFLSKLSLLIITLIGFETMVGKNKNLNTSQPFTEETTEVALIGGGCFWCTEAVFEKIAGVVEVISGYAGGQTSNPTYKEICTGKTGHAEVIKIIFDPKITTFAKILEVFGAAHDPTTLNRQGADVGTQYRSTIMYLSEKQEKIAIAWKKKLSDKFVDPVVTEIVPAPPFILPKITIRIIIRKIQIRAIAPS